MHFPPLSSTIQEKMVGHQDALERLRTLYASDSLAPCWLLVGQRGIGKATFAYQFAKEVLVTNPQNLTGLSENIVSRQIKAGSYPNLLVIERSFNKEGEQANEISVDEARKVLEFLHQSAAIPGWRVVIVDAVDELNRAAANSLLKILEEPPQKTLFLLVCHALGQVLPTIRSRCQQLNFSPLTFQDLNQASGESLSEDLASYVKGSLGLYRSLIDAGGMDFIQSLAHIIHAARKGQMSVVQKFCEEVAKDPKRYTCFLWLIEQWLYKVTIKSSGEEQAYWVQVWERLTAFLKGAKTTHLDKTQIMLSCFLIIENPNIYS